MVSAEQKKESHRKWRLAHLEQRREYHKRWYSEHVEEQKQYRLGRAEKIKEAGRNYRLNNVELSRDRCRKYRLKHAEVRKNRKDENYTQWRAWLPEEWKRCFLCGYSESYDAIECHHIDPKTKVCKLSKITQRLCNTKNQKLFLAEMEKCVALCANCHKILHAIMRKNGWY